MTIPRDIAATIGAALLMTREGFNGATAATEDEQISVAMAWVSENMESFDDYQARLASSATA